MDTVKESCGKCQHPACTLCFPPKKDEGAFFYPPSDCKAKPCDDALRCIKAGRCCYKSSAEESHEVRTRADTAPNPMSEPMGTILHEALAITGNGGERNDSYDHPFPNFSKIAACWSVLFGVTVTPRQVALAMILMKVLRDNHKGKRDNLVDIAGYARCIERLEEWTGAETG